MPGKLCRQAAFSAESLLIFSTCDGTECSILQDISSKCFSVCVFAASDSAPGETECRGERLWFCLEATTQMRA